MRLVVGVAAQRNDKDDALVGFAVDLWPNICTRTLLELVEGDVGVDCCFRVQTQLLTAVLGLGYSSRRLRLQTSIKRHSLQKGE